MVQKFWKNLSSLFTRLPIAISCLVTFLLFSIFLLQYLFPYTNLFSSLSFLLHPSNNIFAVLERASFDEKIRKRKDIPLSNDIAIIGIGKATLQKLGRYPFNRRVYADLLNKLEEAEVKVAVFDIIFAEKEKFENGNNNEGLLHGDDAFARSLQLNKMSVVFGYFFNNFALSREYIKNIDNLNHKENSLENILYLPIISNTDNNLEALGILSSSDPVSPAVELFKYVDKSKHNVGRGFLNSTKDTDGVLRKIPLITLHKNHIYPSLSLRAVELFFQERAVFASSNGFASSTLYFSNQDAIIPIDHYGKIWINYLSGHSGDFPSYEFIDVLPKSAGGTGKITKKELSGKLIFIGVTSVSMMDIGTMDMQSTPLYTNKFPGVKIHASIANSIIKSSYIRDDPYYFWVGFLALSIGSMLFLWLVMTISPVYSILFTIAALFVLQRIDFILFFSKGIIIPTAMISTQYFFILGFSIIYKFLLVDKEKRFTKEAFSHFISPAVVDGILKDHRKLSLGREKKDISVFFADLEGFTTISDKVDENIVSEFVNAFFTDISKLIIDNKGTLDKYTGDGIMCFWGAPLEEKEHAYLACEVALQMEEAVKKIGREWEVRLNHPIRFRIGISSGEMTVGNVGSKESFNYTVLGDKVNLGSRLENLNKLYRTKIIVSENTYSACKDRFVFRCLDFVRVEGRSELENVYELVDRRAEESKWEEWIATFNRARILYQEKNWEEAKVAFQLCRRLHPEDEASLVFLDRMKKESESGGSSGQSSS